MSQRDALDIVKENYREFFSYTMQFRTYPSVYDGCKLAQRRCLYASFSKIPASKMTKLSTHTGMTMTLHPHAEATEVIVKLAGQHQSAYPLYDTQGEFGDIYGNNHAAPRYLECRLNDNARKLYFSLIDKAPFENFEVEKEPIYLPTLFPLAFLQGCFSIGQGTPNPLIPDLMFDDLKKYIINYIKTGKTTVDKDNFVRFVDYDKIRDDKEKNSSICNVLNTGKGNVYYAPTVTLKDNIITITNLYVLANFKSLMDRFKDDIQADKIDIRDESSEERIWVIEKVKNKSFDMTECAKIVKQKFTYKENYAMYFHDEEGRVKPYSLGEVIEKCYSKYREAYLAQINSEIDELDSQQMVLSCLGLMAEHTDIVTDNKLSDDAKITTIKKVINNEYNESVIKKCLEKPIKYLKKDNKAVKDVKNKIKKLQDNIKNIDDVIVNELEKL